MHLKSLKFWTVVFIGMAVFDFLITHFYTSQEQFGVELEGNSLVRVLMAQFGISQGLLLCLSIELAYCFLILGGFFLIVKRWMNKKPKERYFKVDIVVFNIGIPFILIAIALGHLFGGLSWVIGTTGVMGLAEFLQVFALVLILCGTGQAYNVYKITQSVFDTSSHVKIEGDVQ